MSASSSRLWLRAAYPGDLIEGPYDCPTAARHAALARHEASNEAPTPLLGEVLVIYVLESWTDRGGGIEVAGLRILGGGAGGDVASLVLEIAAEAR